eukprot:5628780-Pleurochrysis_carterae.AAC.1
MHSDIRCWRDIWDIAHDPIGCIRSTAMFYMVPVPTIMEAIINMGLRAILEAAGRERVGSMKAVGLCKWFKYFLNRRKNDPNLAGSELAAAEEMLLLKWDAGVPLSGVYFDAPAAAVAPAEASAASHSASSAGGAASSNASIPTEDKSTVSVRHGEASEQSRERPHED